MRCKDIGITRQQLDTSVEEYEVYFQQLTHYSYPLAYLLARYSRGDDLQDLASVFVLVVEKVEATNALNRSKYGSDTLLFAHQNMFAGLFRDALVLVSLGLCLHVPTNLIGRVLACCERGDPLLETIVAASAPSLAVPTTRPAFPKFFDGLYVALNAEPDARARIIADYLAVWSDQRMQGFGFKIAHQKIGYWCFEAAGLVAALDIDHHIFAEHPHFPIDMIAFYHRHRADRM